MNPPTDPGTRRETANRALNAAYARVLHLYPRPFQQAFGEEMQEVFADLTFDALQAGLLTGLAVALRELAHAPLLILRAYGAGLQRHPASMGGGVTAWPQSPDGRDSWAQAWLEALLFLLMGAALIVATYVPAAWPGDGWQHDLNVLGIAAAVLPLPAFAIGLALGLPRWAYPQGGLLLGYSFLAAQRYHALPIWAALLAAGIAFVVVAALVDARWPLPIRVRRLADSLRRDGARLSFGLYGLVPWLVLLAYDDAHTNARTPYVAFSALAMLAGALVFCRSRRPILQIGALLCGLAGAILPAVPDAIHFWAATPGGWSSQAAWVLRLWGGASFLLLAPGWITAVGRRWRARRTA